MRKRTAETALYDFITYPFNFYCFPIYKHGNSEGGVTFTWGFTPLYDFYPTPLYFTPFTPCGNFLPHPVTTLLTPFTPCVTPLTPPHEKGVLSIINKYVFAQKNWRTNPPVFPFFYIMNFSQCSIKFSTNQSAILPPLIL